jgi:HAD superfamily hydrolase (TIGR01509 family)
MNLIEKPPLAVVVDLDDTLFPQCSYLYGAARAVGRAGAGAGLDQVRLSRAVRRQLVAASDREGAIDRALAACGITPDLAAGLVPVLVAAFATYRPRRLPCYPGALDALIAISARFPVACLTDGDPAIQRAKLAATGLADAFTTIVITDELGGRTLRKPHPEGLRQAAETLGVHPSELVVIGDRPTRDMAVAAALGARSIRVRTGVHADAPDDPAPTAHAPDLPAAAALLGLPVG